MKRLMFWCVMLLASSLAYGQIDLSQAAQLERAQERATQVTSALDLSSGEKAQLLTLFTNEESQLSSIMNQKDKSIRQIKGEVNAVKSATSDKVRDIVGAQKYSLYKKLLKQNAKQKRMQNKVQEEQQKVNESLPQGVGF